MPAITDLLRPHLRARKVYAPGASPPVDTRAVRLDWNESPFPPSPKARRAIETHLNGNRYPDFQQTALRESLGRYIDAPADRIIAGAGLDDVLNTIAMMVIEPGEEVIVSEPTFGVYRSLFSLHGASVRNVPLGTRPGFSLDTAGILDAIGDRTKLVIVCNPNNPTGTHFAREDVERIVDRSPCLVAIDEAYAEFSGTSHRDLVDMYENVVILRTMSKFAGLAGFRVGYGVFPEILMSWLREIAPPFFNISAVAAAAAIASLDDVEHLRANVATIIEWREQLRAALLSIDGVTVFPSATNFLLVQLPMEDASPVVGALAANNVFVRHFPSPALGLRDCLRVSIGTAKENELFLALLNAELERKRGARSTMERG